MLPDVDVDDAGAGARGRDQPLAHRSRRGRFPDRTQRGRRNVPLRRGRGVAAAACGRPGALRGQGSREGLRGVVPGRREARHAVRGREADAPAGRIDARSRSGRGRRRAVARNRTRSRPRTARPLDRLRRRWGGRHDLAPRRRSPHGLRLARVARRRRQTDGRVPRRRLPGHRPRARDAPVTRDLVPGSRPRPCGGVRDARHRDERLHPPPARRRRGDVGARRGLRRSGCAATRPRSRRSPTSSSCRRVGSSSCSAERRRRAGPCPCGDRPARRTASSRDVGAGSSTATRGPSPGRTGGTTRTTRH